MSAETKTKHTPGPWEVVMPGDRRGQPVAFYAGLVALVSLDPAIGIKAATASIVTDGREAQPHQWEANARLMAAAPEMFDAIEAVLWCFHQKDDPTPEQMGRAAEKCRAAWCKAAQSSEEVGK